VIGQSTLFRANSIIAIATVINMGVVWYQSGLINESNRQAAKAADAAALAAKATENQLVIGAVSSRASARRL
jgi:hypothetical protein